MLKRLSIRKITLASAALFACMLIYLVPSVREENNWPEDLEYVDNETDYSPVFLLDKNNYVALTEVSVSNDDNIENKFSGKMSNKFIVFSPVRHGSYAGPRMFSRK